MDYKFGNKNNWRRTVWNAIAERLAVPAREAVVLYLGGPEDLDREVAVRKGFRKENLIFVDRDPLVVRAQRSQGKLCLQGDLCELIYAWPKAPALHVIFGDFCSGLERKLFGHIGVLAAVATSRHAVLAFNVLRGRDSSSNELRALWQAYRPPSKHRGRMLWTEFLTTCIKATQGHFILEDTGLRRRTLTPLEQETYLQTFERCKRGITEFCRPVELTYVSDSTQHFDSTVFIHPLRGASIPEWQALDHAIHGLMKSGRWQRLRRCIAATLAHRTMRKAA